MNNGGALLPLNIDQQIMPTIDNELKDSYSSNHLLFLFKFLSTQECFKQRYPPSDFPIFQIVIELWPYGETTTPPFVLEEEHDGIFIIREVNRTNDDLGALLSADFKLKTTDQLLNYFAQLNSDEIQAVLKDYETGMKMGYFTIPSAALLRQGVQSLQFTHQSNLTAFDEEVLGQIHFACGSYGTKDYTITEPEFKLRNSVNDDIIIVRPLNQVDQDFADLVKDLPFEPRYQLAKSYRQGKKDDIILNDLQQRFLRTILLYPVPGIESRFQFKSSYEAIQQTIAIIEIQDERVRFLGKGDPAGKFGFNPSNALHIFRNESANFNNIEGLPIEKRFNLTSASTTIEIYPDSPLLLNFAYFAINEVIDKEINVLIKEKSTNEILDCFSITIKSTNPIVHENITMYIPKNTNKREVIRTNNIIESAIASSTSISITEITQQAIYIATEKLKHSMKSFIFLFGPDQALKKIIRLSIIISKEAVSLSLKQKLKLNTQKSIGRTILCKSNDYRIARFLTEGGKVYKNPGYVMVYSEGTGSTQIIIWDKEKEAEALSVLINVNDDRRFTNNLGSFKIKAKVGHTVKKSFNYINKKDITKAILLTSSDPSLVAFYPSHYKVGPKETVKIFIELLPNPNAGEEIVTVQIHEIGSQDGNECCTFQIEYTN